MSFLTPKTTPAPPPPAITDTTAQQQDYADMLRQRRGRAAMVVPQTGGPATVATKTLLGS